MADNVRAVPGGDAARRARGADGPGDLAHQLRDLLPDGADEAILTQFRNWDAESQRRALDHARSARARPYRKFYCPRPACDGMPHGKWTWNHARADQHPPTDPDWFVWLLLGGRGGGKTRTGAEYTHRMSDKVPRMALVSPTGPDARDIMVEGESGILATSPPGKVPRWEPSKKRLTWPSGCIGTAFSGEEPDRLRGPQHYYAWIDEPAHMPLIKDLWDNLLLGLRLGRRPRICATTTPTPIKWMKDLAKDPLTHTTRFSTYANLANLAEPFKRTVLARYEGTRLGKQELHGEILEDVEGALWTWDLIEPHRVELAPIFDRVVVAIDPAGSARRRSDETGIVVLGRAGQDTYVLADASGRMSPNVWASTAINLYEHWGADAIVAERNFGGDMVRSTLHNLDPLVRLVLVQSRRGKTIRAEPIVGLYEQGRVHHVGDFPELEDQMTSWVAGEGDSPDRVDALVHGATNLNRGAGVVQVASPTRLSLVTGGAA